LRKKHIFLRFCDVFLAPFQKIFYLCTPIKIKLIINARLLLLWYSSNRLYGFLLVVCGHQVVAHLRRSQATLELCVARPKTAGIVRTTEHCSVTVYIRPNQSIGMAHGEMLVAYVRISLYRRHPAVFLWQGTVMEPLAQHQHRSICHCHAYHAANSG
jgi:hypothetical protein